MRHLLYTLSGGGGAAGEVQQFQQSRRVAGWRATGNSISCAVTAIFERGGMCAGQRDVLCGQAPENTAGSLLRVGRPYGIFGHFGELTGYAFGVDIDRDCLTVRYSAVPSLPPRSGVKRDYGGWLFIEAGNGSRQRVRRPLPERLPTSGT